MKKKLLLIIGLIGVIVLLSGCTQIDQDITSESEGIWNSFFVYPLSWLLVKVAEFFNAEFGYGLAIVIVTLLIRFVLLPLNIKQIRSSKAMQQIQPELQKLREKYRSEEHTSELQSRGHLVCRLLLEKKKQKNKQPIIR